MSQENVEIVMRALHAVAQRPRPDFDTINALYHPDHVLVSVAANALGEGEAKGGQGFKAWLRAMEGTTPFELTVDGAVDVGQDKVLATLGVHMRGASSGVEGDQRTWNVVTVVDGKITRTESYNDSKAALEAVRLSE